jgi:hypothetical protein
MCRWLSARYQDARPSWHAGGTAGEEERGSNLAVVQQFAERVNQQDIPGFLLCWALADLRHHLLVLKVDRELGGGECLAGLLGIIDLLGIDEDGTAFALEEVGALVPGTFGAERFKDLVAALRQLVEPGAEALHLIGADVEEPDSHHRAPPVACWCAGSYCASRSEFARRGQFTRQSVESWTPPRSGRRLVCARRQLRRPATDAQPLRAIGRLAVQEV